MVIGRCANTAEGKHDVAAGKCIGQGCGDALRFITQVMRVGHLQATCAQQFDRFGQVLVGTLAREYFVADDDEAKVHAGLRK